MAEGAGATNLEYRLAEGVRGSRHEHAGHLLALACGAEAGIVVNNNAAAVVLVLAALARGREVVVSRGELVEIGGGFRVPEIMAETGARLVEVGTTNRTRRADYERAIGPDTALALKVHASNYRMVGFVESTPVRDLVALGLPVVIDAGSGLLDVRTPWLDTPPAWLGDEPGVRQCLDDGAALVTFSGDKLLGGPQAGLALGTRDAIAAMRKNPLARALRVDKLTLAALDWLATALLDQRYDEIPALRMLLASDAELAARARALAAQLGAAAAALGLRATPQHTDAPVGGGSLPGFALPSWAVALDGATSAAQLASALRRASPAVLARVHGERVLLDVRTLLAGDDALVLSALTALGGASRSFA
jgi:L-seryl-tRNA(Ser) seleniumtransferase